MIKYVSNLYLSVKFKIFIRIRHLYLIYNPDPQSIGILYTLFSKCCHHQC